MYTDYRVFSDSHNGLAMEVLRRTDGGPVTLEHVKSLFVEVFSHDRDCHCRQCEWIKAAKPELVVRAAEYWRRYQNRCATWVFVSG
jgi:hypothetical protein